MLTKEQDVWCPICNTIKGQKIHESEIEVDDNHRLYGEICDSCKELMADCVTLRCLGVAGEIERDWKKEEVPCLSVTGVAKEVLEKNGWIEWKDFELGWYCDIYGCPLCSEDKQYHFKKD